MSEKSFDVFLSHNSQDKPVIRELAAALRDRNLRVWLDEDELRPGLTWQDALEDIIRTCKSAAVCVGPNGMGPWQEPEMSALLRRFVKQKESKTPVIPVLLPDAPADVELPVFLEAFTWVDLRDGLTGQGLDRLEWGVTGHRPTSSPVAPKRATTETAVSAPQTLPSQAASAVALWREKIEFLRQQEAVTADPAQKFSLKKQIQEAEAKIAELEGAP